MYLCAPAQNIMLDCDGAYVYWCMPGGPFLGQPQSIAFLQVQVQSMDYYSLIHKTDYLETYLCIAHNHKLAPRTIHCFYKRVHTFKVYLVLSGA